MATLTELSTLYGDGDLINKVSSALVVEAKAIFDLATPTAAQKAYAAKVFASPKAEAGRVLKYVLAANAGATLASIQGASDAAIQANVATAVPVFVDADAGV